ncbi:MAG: hypothetical protein LBR06_00280 [Bacteroidales bacterium]|jgi:hypothetical protein|nr:hypothetical protein [Bacteroidales bacterium]
MKKMKKISISNVGTREDIRKKLVCEFLNFKQGSGTQYLEVENNGSHSVYIICPGQLNKGIDFVVNVKGFSFKSKSGRNLKNPSHNNIIQDLKDKKASNSKEFNNLISEIENVYSCTEEAISSCSFSVGVPADLLLKILKWLFIEQDITYWTKSGRDMLMNGIRQI